MSTAWRKSSKSGNNGECVEVGMSRMGFAVRDSKDRNGRALAFAQAEWSRFIAAVRAERI